MNTFDSITLIISWISLLVAIIAIIVSIISWHKSRAMYWIEQFRTSNKPEDAKEFSEKLSSWKYIISNIEKDTTWWGWDVYKGILIKIKK